MHRMLIAGVSALALAALSFGVANADPESTAVTPQVTVGADYTYLGLNHSAGNANVAGVSGSGIMPIGSTNFVVQGDVGYHYLSLDNNGGNVNAYNVGGSVAYAVQEGRLGAAVSYYGLDIGHGLGDLGAVSYGAYGEWYLNDRLTAGLKAGAVTPTGNSATLFNHETAGYVGVQAIGYVTPDLSLGGTYDWAGQGPLSVSTAGIQANYQISHSMPLTVFGGWAYTNTTFGNVSLEGNGVNVGVKYTFGGGGSLRHHDRTGVDSWGPVASALRALF